MGDIFLDLRPKIERQPSRVASALKFFDDIHTEVIEREEFSLIFSRPDNLDLWSAYESPDGNLLVALAGRIALTSEQWEQAKKEAGKGGWACKYIAREYRSGE